MVFLWGQAEEPYMVLGSTLFLSVFVRLSENVWQHFNILIFNHLIDC